VRSSMPERQPQLRQLKTANRHQWARKQNLFAFIRVHSRLRNLMRAEIVAANDPDAVQRASEWIRRGEPIAIPTETVYGLAADALSAAAVAKIFAIKERPFFDPLIVHFSDSKWMKELARPDPGDSRLIEKLIERFWPGPLTLLLPKSESVLDLVTAELPTVALRMPSHPVFRAIMRASDRPLAAPSANRFGRVSPSTAEHVFDELGSRIAMIVDAGPAHFGIESTIVQPVGGRIAILRPGPVTEEALAEIAPVAEEFATDRITAPGQTLSHYAPNKPVRLLPPGTTVEHAENSGLLCWGKNQRPEPFSVVRSLSEERDLAEAAARLFSLLREFERLPVAAIYVEPVPDIGVGKAIMNRLRRAAAR
jgi:L-threonylcarbamoyladenylate synthase